MNDFLKAMKSEYEEPLEAHSSDPPIHPSSSVHPDAEIGQDVVIGPFSYVGKNVELGDGCILKNHVNINGHTTIGQENVFFPFCSIGTAPQDQSYSGEPTELIIGDSNVFRESITVNRGTPKDLGETRIGSDNFLMAYTHVAHDCIIEDNITVANGVQLGGHVTVESEVVFGGLAAVHHFATIGRNAFVGGMSRVMRDVPPFMTSAGDPASIRSLNTEGLKRNDFPEETIKALKNAHRTIFRTEGSKQNAIDNLSSRDDKPDEVRELIEFVRRTRSSAQGRAREANRDF